MLLVKKIALERDSRVDTGNISNICTELYAHIWEKKIAWFDISVKGEWREKGKPGGRREKVEGGKIQSAPV